MVSPQHAIQIGLPDIANLMVEAVEVELIGNPPQGDAGTDEQQSGNQSGQQRDFQAKGIQVHAAFSSPGIR